MNFVEQLKGRFAVASELIEFLWTAKLWWMIPMIVLLLLLGGLLLLSQSSAIAPFIYTLF